MIPKAFASIPAQTTEDNPDHRKFIVMRGTIRGWVIFFDPEAANIFHIRIEYHDMSLIPFGGKGWAEGLFSSIPIEDNIKLDVPPYELDIYAYNEDDSFPHEYYIYPIIITEEPFSIQITDQELLETLGKLFGV